MSVSPERRGRSWYCQWKESWSVSTRFQEMGVGVGDRCGCLGHGRHCAAPPRQFCRGPAVAWGRARRSRRLVPRPGRAAVGRGRRSARPRRGRAPCARPGRTRSRPIRRRSRRCTPASPPRSRCCSPRVPVGRSPRPSWCARARTRRHAQRRCCGRGRCPRWPSMSPSSPIPPKRPATAPRWRTCAPSPSWPMISPPVAACCPRWCARRARRTPGGGRSSVGWTPWRSRRWSRRCRRSGGPSRPRPATSTAPIRRCSWTMRSRCSPTRRCAIGWPAPASRIAPTGPGAGRPRGGGVAARAHGGRRAGRGGRA